MPDVLYAYVEFEGFVELYAARSALFSGFFLKMMFMEDVAQQIAQRAKSCGDVRSVTLRLATSRHVVRIDCA